MSSCRPHLRVEFHAARRPRPLTAGDTKGDGGAQRGDDIVQAARHHARMVRGFYAHLFWYAVVIGALAAINVAVSPAYLWVFFPALAWAIGLVGHAFGVYGSLMFGPEWEARKVAKYVQRYNRSMEAVIDDANRAAVGHEAWALPSADAQAVGGSVVGDGDTRGAPDGVPMHSQAATGRKGRRARRGTATAWAGRSAKGMR